MDGKKTVPLLRRIVDFQESGQFLEEDRWFALGAPYRNESKVHDELCKYDIESWIPMVRVRVTQGNRKKWVSKPAVGNLLFAHTTEKKLLKVKPFIPRLQFKVVAEDGTNKKVVVPDDQMVNFIRFVEKLSEVPTFIDPAKLNLRPGDRVKVINGVFEGVEGAFVKVKGHRSKVLCVTLGPLGSAITEIAPEDVQAL